MTRKDLSPMTSVDKSTDKMSEKHRDSHISWLSQSIYNVDGTDPPNCPPPQTIFLPRPGNELVAFTMAGIPISHNCSKTLSAFGLIFMLIGIVLTITAYRSIYDTKFKSNSSNATSTVTGKILGITSDKSKTEESKVLGPACILIAILMWTLSFVLWYLMKRSRDNVSPRLAFHCPLHGDFFPLSLNQHLGSRKSSFLDDPKHHRTHREILSCFPCWKKSGPEDQKDHLTLAMSPDEVIQCPHSTSRYSSNRSSLANVPANTDASPCPTPVPFLVPTPSPTSSHLMQASSTGSLIVLEPYGSIKSLAASHDVACFPVDATQMRDESPQRKSLPSSPLLSRSRNLSLDVCSLNQQAPPISYHVALSPIQSSCSVTPPRLQSAPSIRVTTPEIMLVSPIHPEEEDDGKKSHSAKY